MMVRFRAALEKGSVTAAIAMLARVSSQVALVGVTLVATRVLSPSDFGVFAIGAALLTLARTMFYTGPFEYLLKAPEEGSAGVVQACLLANLIMALGWLVLLGMVGLAAPLLFKGGGVGGVILTLAPSNLVAALAGWMEALLLRSGRVRRYYAVTVAVEFGSGIGTAFLLMAGCGLWALVAQVYMRLLLLIACYAVVVALPVPGCLPPGETRAVLNWSRSRYGSVLVGFLANYSGDLLLGAAFSPAAAGIYRAGNRMVTALADMFAQPAVLLTTTRLSAARARGKADPDIWLRLLALFAALAFPALGGLALMADRITPLVLGPAWSVAGPVVAVFCVARMGGLVAAVASSALVVGDRQAKVLAIQGAAALATGILTLIVVPLGAVAAALAAGVVAIAAAVALFRAALSGDAREPATLADAARMVLLPLAGALLATLAGVSTMSYIGAVGGFSLAVAVISGGIGWALAAWQVAPSLRRAFAVLAERPGA